MLSVAEVSILIAKSFSTLQLNPQHNYLTSFVNTPDFITVMLAVAKTESNYNPLAKNKNSTASGLFQILKGTKGDIEARILKLPKSAVKDIFDAEYNTYLACSYMLYQYQRYDQDWQKAIIAYNQGSYNSSKAGQQYYAKVNSNYEQLTSSTSITTVTTKYKRNFG